MSVCTCLSRCCLTLINLLFCAIGGTLIFLGTFLFLGYIHYGHSGVLTVNTAMLPALILIVVGIIALILGVIGFVAACQDQKCLTGLYFTMLLMMFTGLISGSVLSFLYHYEIDDDLHQVLINSLNEYSEDKEIKVEVDLVQSQFMCCGVDNASDWFNTPWYKNQSSSPYPYPYPHSCCYPYSCTYDQQDVHLHHKGCYSLVKEEFKRHLLIIACVAGAFGFVLVIGMLLSCVLLIQKRRRTQEISYTTLPDPDGMRI